MLSSFDCLGLEGGCRSGQLEIPIIFNQNNFDNLSSLGITSHKIISRPELLGRNPGTVSNYYRYFTNVLLLKEGIVQNLQQLLSENPDSFAKKMRIFKLDILGLKRNYEFDLNDYRSFFLRSPATLMAKKRHYTENKINYKSKIWILIEPWKVLIKKIKKSLSDDEANKEGRRITQLYKQRYDDWMKDYRKWAKDFALRRERRLIIRI